MSGRCTRNNPTGHIFPALKLKKKHKKKVNRMDGEQPNEPGPARPGPNQHGPEGHEQPVQGPVNQLPHQVPHQVPHQAPQQAGPAQLGQPAHPVPNYHQVQQGQDQLVQLLQQLLTINQRNDAQVAQQQQAVQATQAQGLANLAQTVTGGNMPRPEAFWGTKKDTRHARSFLYEYQAWVECAFPLDPTAVTRMLPSCLKDRASLWYFQDVRQTPTATNWQLLEKAFLDEFAQVDPSKLTETYMFRDQLATETVTDYSHAMQSLMAGRDLPEQLKVASFLRGLQRGIAMQVYSKDPKTVREAEKAAKEAELSIKVNTSSETITTALAEMSKQISAQLAAAQVQSLQAQTASLSAPVAAQLAAMHESHTNPSTPQNSRSRQPSKRGRGGKQGGQRRPADPQFDEFLRWKSQEKRRSSQTQGYQQSSQPEQQQGTSQPQQYTSQQPQQYTSQQPQQYTSQQPQQYSQAHRPSYGRFQSPGGRSYYRHEDTRRRSPSPHSNRRPPTPHYSEN